MYFTDITKPIFIFQISFFWVLPGETVMDVEKVEKEKKKKKNEKSYSWVRCTCVSVAVRASTARTGLEPLMV